MNYYTNLTSEEISKIISKCSYCHLTVSNYNVPYTIPVFYEYKKEKERYIFYIKSKCYGKKIDFLKNNDTVCLEFDTKNNEYIDSVVITGNAQLQVDGEIMLIIVYSECINGRRFNKNCEKVISNNKTKNYQKEVDCELDFHYRKFKSISK